MVSGNLPAGFDLCWYKKVRLLSSSWVLSNIWFRRLETNAKYPWHFSTNCSQQLIEQLINSSDGQQLQKLAQTIAPILLTGYDTARAPVVISADQIHLARVHDDENSKTNIVVRRLTAEYIKGASRMHKD